MINAPFWNSIMRSKGPKSIVVVVAVVLCTSALPQGCSSYYSSNNDNDNDNNNNLVFVKEHCANERGHHHHLHSIRRRSLDDLLSLTTQWAGELWKKAQEKALNYADWVFRLWNCKLVGGEQADEQQRTTQLLLFTKPGTEDKPQAIINKNSSRDGLKHKGGFMPMAPTYVMVHGFQGCGVGSQPWFKDAKDLILNKGEANVFFVDWGHHARTLSYTQSLGKMQEVADEIYEMMQHYELAFPARPNQFKMTSLKLVGHSLGAHISGLLGQKMHGQLEEITATDPAGVGFNNKPDKDRLSPDDAKYVQAIHTNADVFGTRLNRAHRDIFYEDGSNQPSCSSSLQVLCNHNMATKYASTYMGRCIQVAYKCPHLQAFEEGACGFCRNNSDDCVAVGHAWQYDMGGHNFTSGRHKKGDGQGDGDVGARYYLKTSKMTPFCAYHFQVVALFSEGSHMGDKEEFRLRLMANITSGLPTELTMRRLRGRGEQLQVFDETGKLKTVEGKQGLYTGLALIRTDHPRYPLMPLKFAQANLLDDIKEPTESLNVYVNFMSHPEMSERAKYSGPVEVKFIPS